MQNPPDSKIAITGLGHVGLPPFEVKLGKRYGAFGFGINRAHIDLSRAHGKPPPAPCDAKHVPPHKAEIGRL